MSGAAKTGPVSLLDYLQLTTTFLAAKGVDGARLDAELLLAEVLGLTRTQLYTNFEKPLAVPEVGRYRELVRRRAAREPVAYITGRREFWSMDFVVDRRVLVPRPETELVVELALDALRSRGAMIGKAPRPSPSRDVEAQDGEGPTDANASQATTSRVVDAGAQMVEGRGGETGSGAATHRVADIGTGSGAIAIAIAKEVASARVIATDRSPAALEIAPGNAARHGVDARIEFLSGDGCAPLAGGAAFDVIASNPPYIRRDEMATLPPEVRDWEPKWALESGADGMDVTTPLVEAAYDLLAPGGWLIVEAGTQIGLVRERFLARGYEGVAVKRDLAGIDRVVTGRRPV